MGRVARDVPTAPTARRHDLTYALSLFGILTFGGGAYGLLLARDAGKLSRPITFVGAGVLVIGIALFVVGITRW